MEREHVEGFSLIELLVVLVVVSILASSGFSLMDVIRRYRFYSDIDAQVGVLLSARNAAANHYVNVSVCPSDDGVACGLRWGKGMLAFEDRNGDAVFDSPERVIGFLVHDAQVGSMKWASFSGRNAVIFDAKGLASASNGTLLVCDQKGHLARKIIVNRGGRVRLKDVSAVDCFR